MITIPKRDILEVLASASAPTALETCHRMPMLGEAGSYFWRNVPPTGVNGPDNT